MDLQLKRGAARTAAFRVFHLIGVVSLLWASSIHADNSITGRDYLLPKTSKGGIISQTPSTQSIQSIQSIQGKVKTQAISNYRALDGSSYQLTENRGRYVNVLLFLHHSVTHASLAMTRHRMTVITHL